MTFKMRSLNKRGGSKVLDLLPTKPIFCGWGRSLKYVKKYLDYP